MVMSAWVENTPEWLQEHQIQGLPSLCELLSAAAGLRMAFTAEVNESILQHLAGLLIDEVFPAAAEYQNLLANKSPIDSPLGGSPWDLPTAFFSIFRVDQHPLRRP